MTETEKLLLGYDEWEAERQELCARSDEVRSSEWQDSDDAAVDLLRAMATELRERPGSYLTVEEIAELMRVSRMTVYRLCSGGDLPAVRIGRSYRVSASGLQTYLQKNMMGRD